MPQNTSGNQLSLAEAASLQLHFPDFAAFSHTVENTIGESVHQATPDLLINEGLALRVAGNEAEGLIDFIKKFVAEPDSLLFMPGNRGIKLCLRRL